MDIGSLIPPSLHNVRRWVWVPWTWLVFIPYLAVSTAFFGSMAFLVAYVSSRTPFYIGCVWARLLCWANFTRVRVSGLEHMVPGQSYVIMSNHESHFDILAVYGHFWRQFRWVMKQELRRVPFLGAACDRIGHIFIDRSDRERAIASLNAAKPRLAGGVSVLFFPEGTRSRDGRMKEFKKGGFVMAQDMALPILPMSVSGTYKVLPGKSLRLLPGSVRITLHAPVNTAAYGPDDRDRLIADVRARIASGLTAWERGDAPAGPQQ
jgi:1-acyl-sn-glycerol-3-phosphate acyltransferase